MFYLPWLLKFVEGYSCCSNLLRIKPEKTLIFFCRSLGYVSLLTFSVKSTEVDEVNDIQTFLLQNSSSSLVHTARY